MAVGKVVATGRVVLPVLVPSRVLRLRLRARVMAPPVRRVTKPKDITIINNNRVGKSTVEDKVTIDVVAAEGVVARPKSHQHEEATQSKTKPSARLGWPTEHDRIYSLTLVYRPINFESAWVDVVWCVSVFFEYLSIYMCLRARAYK